MIEKGKRGGVCQVSSKYAKANNKYMKDYDNNTISSYLTYLDANNLYGLAMCMTLPYGNLKWSNDIDTSDDVMKYEDNDVGILLEVDLHYPKHLHDQHKDYPLAPQIMNVKESMVSDVSKEIFKCYNNGTSVKDEKTSKLLLTLYDKDKYVIHIRNLKYYLEKGLVFEKVHRCIKFNQGDWLKECIDFNTEKRKEATNDFDKYLFKLMNNAVYGKTMEDVRGHVDFESVDTPERMEKLLDAPTLKHRHLLNDNLVGVEKIKPVMKLNKPIYIGVCILGRTPRRPVVACQAPPLLPYLSPATERPGRPSHGDRRRTPLSRRSQRSATRGALAVPAFLAPFPACPCLLGPGGASCLGLQQLALLRLHCPYAAREESCHRA